MSREGARFLAFAEKLADAAARETLPRFRADGAVANKAAKGFDPVTEADKEAEAAIRRLIRAEFPDHGVLGEEHGHEKGKGPYTWVIDPIDGTRSFIAGVPLWTTLIALNDGTRPIVGLIDQPYLGERFLAAAGGAARLLARAGTQTLRTRKTERLADAILSSTTPELFESAAQRRLLDTLMARTRLTRFGFDCYAYGLVAAGHIDLVVERMLMPWDTQAFIPVIEAAGGAVASWTGGTADQGGSVVAAATRALLDETLALIAELKAE